MHNYNSSNLFPFLFSQGLKTGMYYLRTKPAAAPIQFTLDKLSLKNKKGVKKDGKEAEAEQAQNLADMVCSIDNKEACMSCSG